jgi:hypothetical protein
VLQRIRSVTQGGGGRLLGFARTGQTLGLNAVPILGFFGAGWSEGTTLAFYWFETVLLTVSVSVLISVHRRRTRCAGHWLGIKLGQVSQGPEPDVGENRGLADFLSVMVPFTLGHGAFVALLTFLGLPNMTGQPSPGLAELGAGAGWALLFVMIGLRIDLVGIGSRPFAWIETTARSLVGRMVLTHLTIVFGFGAMAYTDSPEALFAVFFGLKTAVDLARQIPKGSRAAPSRETPWWVEQLDRWFPREGKTWAWDWQEHHADWKAFEAAHRQLAADKERIVPLGSEPPPANGLAT